MKGGMTSDRPYRKSISFADALGFIKTQAGLHFDPVMAEKFVSLQEVKLGKAKYGEME
jgi:HD-GYP domain-containing protein (c-di-GMP phosphodiesterase class II)